MFRICRIIAETTEAVNTLKEYLGGYPVEITQQVSEENYFEVPTLMLGWNSVKNRFPNQKIHEKNVVSNLYWTYNEYECNEIQNESFYKNIEEFVNDNLKKWLPSDFIMIDPLMCDVIEYLNYNLDKKNVSYVHFDNGAMYIRNGNNNYILNVKNLWLLESKFKTKISEILNNFNCMLFTYSSIEEYLNLDTLSKNIKSLDIIRWIKFGVETHIKYFQIVPNLDVNKYIPFLMSKIPLQSLELDEEEEVYFNRMCIREKATRWMSTRYVSFSYEFDKKLDFLYRENAKLAKISYSNKKTITGRITSNDQYNPQNLSKNNNERAMIVSRFRGGKIYQFDYNSFETRIALYLCDDEDFLQNYYDKDLHSETARIIFETSDFTTEQRDIAKLVNHAILYGASEGTILKKLEGLPDPNSKVFRVKDFLSPIFRKSKELMELAENKGYIINRWGSIIKPEKSYAGFNNYIQSTASEIIVDKVLEIKNLMLNLKSQFMFQVHDSLIFDIHPEEFDMVGKIAETLSYHNGMLFTINYKSGPNYKDLSSESVYF